jgi:ferredoxin
LRAAGWKARPATEVIARLAKGRKAVFFNEAHNIVQTRALTVRMLKALREEGFNYFAAETLYETDTDLARRGYPTAESGFYLQEPVYAEMVRTALDLGYKVVAYEAVANPRGDAREREQARHLYDRVFAIDPDARLVVNAGYAHVQETGKYLDGKSMAAYFRARSGVDPLTIEQTMMIEHDTPDHDHPIYRAVVAAARHPEPFVYVDDAGKPWSLKPDFYDLSVFLPPDVERNGRPDWLDLGGLRRPFKIDQELCDGHFPCLVEARYADEGKDAIPADRVMLFHREPNQAARFKELYLRPGKYVMEAIDHNNNLITRRRIGVDAGTTKAGR